ncbi:MAG: pilus assembly protein TadG-related protein [Candidatus Nanopelagicales bacterium]
MIRWIRRRRNADEGTIMVLVLGLVPVVAGLIAVGTDAAVLFSHRRALVSHADAAALAAAQSADLGTLYTARKIESLPLDCRTARSVVTRRIEQASEDSRATAPQLADFSCNRNAVRVRLRSKAQLPFAKHFGIEPTVEVAADAAATSPLR